MHAHSLMPGKLKAAASVAVIAALTAGLVAGLAAPASGGSGDASAVAAAGKKKKKKKCPAGTTKKVVKKKNGKKKVTCVPNPVTPPPVLAANLSITPSDFDFGGVSQGGLDNCQPAPDPDCPTQNFTVTNAGPGPSGTPAVSIVDIATDFNGTSGFQIFANGCTAPLAPGASCVVTVRAGDDTNFTYQARLNVTASPGTTVSATMEVS